MLSDFKKFVLRGNVVDLSVAIVVGVAFTAMITAFVADLVTPLIAAIFGKPIFGGLFFTLHHSQFKYGLFLDVLLVVPHHRHPSSSSLWSVPLTAAHERLNLVPKEEPKPDTRERPERRAPSPSGRAAARSARASWRRPPSARGARARRAGGRPRSRQLRPPRPR